MMRSLLLQTVSLTSSRSLVQSGKNWGLADGWVGLGTGITFYGTLRSSPEKWLQLVSKTPLKKLVYIDIGVGYQVRGDGL